MKKYAAWLFSVLLAVCLTAGAEAQASKEAQIERYIGGWIGEDYRMYVRLEDDEIYSRLTQAFGNYVWEFDRCRFDAEEDLLYAPNCVRYRQIIDWDSMELVREDWSLGDLGFTCFAFADDEDTLVGTDIPNIDGPVTFRRVSDEEYFGF